MKKLFAQLSKVTEQPDGTCIVRGRMTAEELDKANEILDYAKSKPQIEKWRDESLAASGGKSLGNIRSMHGKIAAGVATNIYFDDAAKAVDLESHIIDLQEAKKCVAGVYTGYSIGGDYAERWPDEVVKGAYRFVPTMVETSLVDKPCVASATFSYVKADGTAELRKFIAPLPQTTAKEDILQKFGSILDRLDLTAIKTVKHLVTESTGVEHLPYTDASGKPDHHLMGTAWAALHEGYRGNKYAGPNKDAAIKELTSVYANEGMKTPDAQKALLSATLISLRKRAERHHGLEKGMWSITQLADVLQTLAWMHTSLDDERIYENDDSPIPDKLRAILVQLKPLFIELATEEVNELIREEEAEKAIPTGQLAKTAPPTTKGKEATVAEKNEKLIKLQQAAVDHLGKAMGHLEKAQASHDKMDTHLGAMEKACKALDSGELAKSPLALELKKGLLSSVEALRAEHGKMEEHHDNIESELEDLQDSAAEDENEDNTSDTKKAREIRMQKKMDRTVEKRVKEIRSDLAKQGESNAQVLDAMSKALERMAGGGLPATTAAPGTPQAAARTAVTVEKADDTTGAPAVPAVAAAAPGTVPPAGPTLVKAIRADGMPNQDFVDTSAAAHGDAFVKAAAGAKQQGGDPFPPSFGKLA